MKRRTSVEARRAQKRNQDQRRSKEASDTCGRPVHSPAVRPGWSRLVTTLSNLVTNPYILFACAVTSLLPLYGPYLLRMLPSPEVHARIQLFPPITSGTAIGCVVYMVTVTTPKISRLDLTLQFPGDIASFKFGAANAAQFSGPLGRVGMVAFEIGRDANGECSVIQAAVTESPDVTLTKAGGGMVQVRGRNVLPYTTAGGAFALSSKPPSFKPAAQDRDRSGDPLT
jgi:hypothetical protein